MRKMYAVKTEVRAVPGILIRIFVALLLTGTVQYGWAQCPQPYTVSATQPSVNATTGTWTAPATGGPYLVKITAAGAKGGDNISSQAGGNGATMQGTFVVNAGQTLNITAGAPGASSYGAGGGGGSGVYIQDGASQNILLIAGGGGGASSTCSNCGVGLPGVTTTDGTSGSNTNCNGVTGMGGGGGGYSTAGSNGVYTNTTVTGGGGGGSGFTGIGGYGAHDNYSSSGNNGYGGGGVGGGGGGTAQWYYASGAGGGGGGYNGGLGSCTSGGGGGSINNGTNQTNTSGSNAGGGYVSIECLGTVSITSSTGNNQSATVNTAFATPLSITLSANAAPVSGTSVTFTAPASGASGTFSNGTNTITVVTDADGVASAGTFTANAIVGGLYSVTATVAGSSLTTDLSLTNNAAVTSCPSTYTLRANTPSVNATTGTWTAPATGGPYLVRITAAGAKGGDAISTCCTHVGGSGAVMQGTFVVQNGQQLDITAGAPGGSGSENPYGVIGAGGGGGSGVYIDGTQTVLAIAGGGGGAIAGYNGFGGLVSTNGQSISSGGTGGSAGSGSTNNFFSGGGGGLNSAGTSTYTSYASSGGGGFNGIGGSGKVQCGGSSGDGGGGVGGGGGGFAEGPGCSETETGGGGGGYSGGGGGSVQLGSFTGGGGGGSINNGTNQTNTAGANAGGGYVTIECLGPAPATITATDGTPQSNTVNTAFATNLQATVTDAASNPVSGASVTFTAPASGASGTFANSTNTITVPTDGNGVATVPFTANGTDGQYTVSAAVSGVATAATFTLTNTLPLVNVTINTAPDSRSFNVDGTDYTTSQTFQWVQGSSHTIATTSPQSGSTGTQYVFSSWSDIGAISHNVAPASSVTYTANFTTQYQLTTSAGTGGSISPTTGYYDAGSNIPITATANAGYTFSGFSGALTGTTNPQTLNLTAPASVTANFVAAAVCGNATALLTSNITATSALLNWTAATNPVSWQVQYKSTAPGAKWMDVAGVLPSARSVTISGLKPKQAYNWHIRAKCGKTWTSYSNAVSFTTLAATLSVSNAITSTGKPIGESESLHVVAQPNPTSAYFTLVIQSNDNRAVLLNMIDAVGRVVEGRTGLAPNSTLYVGQSYRPGVYFAQVMQGSKMVTLKLIKQ